MGRRIDLHAGPSESSPDSGAGGTAEGSQRERLRRDQHHFDPRDAGPLRPLGREQGQLVGRQGVHRPLRHDEGDAVDLASLDALHHAFVDLAGFRLPERQGVVDVRHRAASHGQQQGVIP